MRVHPHDEHCRCDDVDTFDDLVAASFSSTTNALRLRRSLPGDFAALARLLAPAEGLVVVDPDALRALHTSAEGDIARAILLEDLQRFADLGHDPVLNCIASYPRDERGLPIATDVLSFHVDSAPVDVDTWLCTYAGASSDGLHDGDAFRLVDDDTVRASLRELHARGVLHDDARCARDRRAHAQRAVATDDDFAAFLREHSFDLHYRAKPGARPYAFGTGHLWRLAVARPGSPTTPCIHRAPTTTPDDEPRLLLIC